MILKFSNLNKSLSRNDKKLNKKSQVSIIYNYLKFNPEIKKQEQLHYYHFKQKSLFLQVCQSEARETQRLNGIFPFRIEITETLNSNDFLFALYFSCQNC